MSETRSGKKKVLVLDDESPIAEMISDFCQLLGFETKILNSGENVLQVVKAYRPDLITLDLIMPEISGLEVLEILKMDPETKDIPIIIISSIAGSLSVKDFLKQCQILAKPVKIEDLKEKINAVLPQH